MQTKELTTMVVVGTLLINLVLFKAGIPQTLTCTIAQGMGANVILAKNP